MFWAKRIPKFISDDKHQFSAHWFSDNRWQFERHLSFLAGSPCRLLEIGCFEGEATCWLLENVATAACARITCIDIGVQPSFWQNIGASGGDEKIDFKIGRSRDILPMLRAVAFDFIFVDGDHAAISVIEDAVLSFRLAKVGAVIAFDDYKWNDQALNMNGVPRPSIDAFLSIYREKIEILSKNYQVWIRKIAD